jgi:hypothetical protein
MRVLVACEYSGIVRDAFIARGHDAMSCDLLDTERPGPHYVGDVRDVLYDGWDLMIAHPPCTYLSYAGTRHWNTPGRISKRLDALEFFRMLWEAPIDKICLENPKGCASPVIAKYSQEIQPYYFGDSSIKTTWLWLKNLPLLVHVNGEDDLFDNNTHVNKPEPVYIDNGGKARHFTEAMKGTDRAKDRAKTFQGIADAMADQWGHP